MSREIKFRAWDKNNKEMHFQVQAGLDLGIELSFGSLLGIPGRFEIMQFTGLIDKNGKEIYEGDIVNAYQKLWEIPRPLICQIIYNSCRARFEPIQFWECKNEWLPLSDNFCMNYYYEVIGNIYENEHLLTHPKK